MNSVVYGRGQGAQTGSSLQIQYRTKNMDEPRMLYQKCSGMEEYVAVMAQFLPTFEQRYDNETPTESHINFMDDCEL